MTAPPPPRRPPSPEAVADEGTTNAVGVRLGAALLIGTAAYVLPFGAVIGVLLPARLAEIAPDHKVDLLALIMAATALAGLVGNLVCGLLSDRTRTRLGARLPWLLGGALVGALLLVPLAGARDVVGLLCWWCAAVVAFNAMVVAVTTTLAERVPRARRASLAASAGAGNLLGQAAGTWLGAVTLSSSGTGILVVAVLVVPLALVAAALARQRGAASHRPTVPAGPADRHVRRAHRGLVGALPSPGAAPDFYRALVGRLLLVLGYFMIDTFQLYLFTDYLRLPPADVGPALARNAVVFFLAALTAVAVAGPTSDRCGRRRPFVAGGALIFVVGTGVPLAVPTPAGMLGFSLLSGIGFGVVYSVDAALLTEVLPRPLDHGRDLGVLNAANIGGQVLAPAASSALVRAGAGFAPVFAGSMVACALGGLCVLRIRSVR